MADNFPVVSIVGRRNTGKSTLFNSLMNQKKAIVDSYSGLTRDILTARINYKAISFVISDTPGLDLPSSSELSGPIVDNAMQYLKKSSLIILLMEQPHPQKFDLELADMLRKTGVSVVAVMNKVDSPRDMEHALNFYEEGFAEVIPISALNRVNIDVLKDKIIELLPVKKTAVYEPDISIAIAGRPNSGKSTLLNSFAGYERSIVSEIPGTTRDSVDEEFMFHGKRIRVIDTAGIRKKGKISGSVDFFSLRRSLRAIENSDVTIHLIDASLGITDTDKKIADEIVKAKRPALIAVNKWDLIEKDHRTFDEFKQEMTRKFYKTTDFPVISISAKDKLRINRLITTAIELKEGASVRLSTGRLNRIINDIQNSGRVPELGQSMRIYYAAQTGSSPPRFRLFVNNPELFRRDAIRHIEKELRKEIGMTGVPIIIHLEGKKQTEIQKRNSKKKKDNKKRR